MKERHRLLRRQLRRCFGEREIPDDLEPLLDLVDQAYREDDLHRQQLERSLELTSDELLEQNAQLERDLEARVAAEAALRESEAKLRAILSGHPDTIYVVERDGTLVAAHVEDPALPDVQPGENLFAAIPEERRAVATAQAQLAWTENRLVEDEFSRDQRWVNVRFIPDGNRYLTCILRDVTAQRSLEQQVIVAERMASIGTLVAGVAHEINNPLAYVVSNLSFIRDELASDMPNLDVMEALDEAEMGADRVRKIVNDLRALSHGSVEMSVCAINLQAAAQSAVSIARVKLSRHTRLEIDLDPQAWVSADESQLAQVVLNLLVNAAQAIPEDSDRSHSISVRSSIHGDEVFLEVADDGPGIPVAVRDRLFEPFFTTKSLGKGTGLGLAISRRLIEGFGGRLDLISTEVGACFRITLQRAKGMGSVPPAREPEDSVVQPRTGARVLVIDDEIDLGRAIRRILKGHDVTLTTQGRRGLQLILEEDFDLVLCDLMMPELTGDEIYDHLAENAPELLERVVFMTGGALTEAAQRFLDASFRPCIEKPFEPTVLRNFVARSVRRRQRRDAAPRTG